MDTQRKFEVTAYFPIGMSARFPGCCRRLSSLSNPTEAPLEKLLKVPFAAFLFALLGVFVAPFVEEIIFVASSTLSLNVV